MPDDNQLYDDDDGQPPPFACDLSTICSVCLAEMAPEHAHYLREVRVSGFVLFLTYLMGT